MNRITFILLLALFSCHKEQEAPVGYYVEFEHNETLYKYENPDHTYRSADLGTVTHYLTVANFFDDQGASVSLIVGAKYPTGTRLPDIIADHTGAVDVTIDPDPEPGTFYLSPFFHRSANGGYLERDGNEVVELDFVSVSDVAGNCFDAHFTFSLFANSGDPDCISQCENDFRGGVAKIRLCYD